MPQAWEQTADKKARATSCGSGRFSASRQKAQRPVHQVKPRRCLCNHCNKACCARAIPYICIHKYICTIYIPKTQQIYFGRAGCVFTSAGWNLETVPLDFLGPPKNATWISHTISKNQSLLQSCLGLAVTQSYMLKKRVCQDDGFVFCAFVSSWLENP